MLTVDTFIKRNSTIGFGIDREIPFVTKSARFHIPSMTMEQAYDFCGFNEDEEITAPVPILPYGGYSKRGEHSNIDGYMKRHEYEIVIEYECPCDTEKKILHHPSYDDYLRVHKLCHKCHAKAHSAIYQQEKQSLTLMIAVKMILKKKAKHATYGHCAEIDSSTPSRQVESRKDIEAEIGRMEQLSLDFLTGLEEADDAPFQDRHYPAYPKYPSSNPAPVTAFAVDVRV